MARAFEPTCALLAPFSLGIGVGLAHASTPIAVGGGGATTPHVFDATFSAAFN